MIKSRRKTFKESLSSVRNEIRDMFEDIKDGLESARDSGSDVSDIMVVVQTWDVGAPVLVKGAYNYYSGDIRCSADEFIDDHNNLIRDYMKDFDEEVKDRNEMLDDILNKMHDDVESGDLDEDEYYEEEHRLMDDTCTWSVSVEISKDKDEIKSSMAVSVESGDAEVIDSDTLSVDEVEKWCKKKSESRNVRESRIARRRNGLRKVLENRRKKNESRGNKRWFVIDLNTTEECDSLEKALEKAEWWMELQRDICKSEDDDWLLYWLKSPEGGLDAGDVEVYEVDLDEVDLDDITEYNGRICRFSGRQIRNLLDPVEVFSGKSVIRDVAEERGLI